MSYISSTRNITIADRARYVVEKIIDHDFAGKGACSYGSGRMATG